MNFMGDIAGIYGKREKISAKIAKSRLLWCKAEDAKPRGYWMRRPGLLTFPGYLWSYRQVLRWRWL